MRIIGCHIEGFGKITNSDFDFKKDVTSFCFENGHGKTTLADFIKAMLYGLESVKSNSKNFEDRLHYLPFSGAKFGGSMTVSVGSDEYRIERFFDKKSKPKDTLKVYKNNRETDECGDEVGLFLLGLDKESFERTLFSNAKDEFFGSTDGINAKLNRFSSGEESAAAACSALEKAKRTIRAAKGSNDLISKAERERLELISQISNLEALSDELGTLYKKREALIIEVTSLEKKQNEIANKRYRASLVDSYRRMSEEASSRERTVKEIEERYKNGTPSTEDITLLRRTLSEERIKLGELESGDFSESAEARLLELGETFKCGTPSDEELSLAESAAREKERLSERLRGIKFHSEGETDERLLPGEGDLSAARERLAEYNGLRREIEGLVSADTRQKKSIKAPIFAIGIALIVASVPFAFFFIPVFFAGFLLGGAACLMSFEKSGNGDVAVRLAEIRTRADEAAESLKLFLARYGFFTENGIIHDFSQLENACEKHKTNQTLKEERSREAAELESRLADVNERISSLLSRFAIQCDDPFRGVSTLRALSHEYLSLKAQKTSFTEKKSSARTDFTRLSDKKREIAHSMGFSPEEITDELLDRLAKDRQTLDLERAALEKSRALIAEYRAKNNITDEEISSALSTAVDFSELPLDEGRRALAALDREISEIEERVQFLPEKQSALDGVCDHLSSLRHRLDIITKTQNFISRAEENLLEKFVSPVMNSFKGYLSLLSETTGENFSMDLSFKLMFEDGGEMRDEKHLSAGQRAIVNLCLRLSLADALFGEDGQFILLDDPFVNLDETHLEKVKIFIEKMATKHQIVYFCCHNSRKI